MGLPKNAIMMPELCFEHQKLLVSKAGVPESGPWRSLIIVAQLALFQAASADDKIQKEIGGDIHQIGKIGCLACRKQSQFWDLIEAYKKNNLTGMKELGELWIKEAAAGSDSTKV
jgi:hypothetical protein